MIETHFFSTYLLPIVLAVIMFGMGSSLTFADFRNIWVKPGGVIAGLVCQLVLLPMIAVGIAFLSGLRPEHQVGLVLVAACPGGAIANLLSYMLKGSVALSVSFTAVNSFITIFTIPLVVNIALDIFMGTNSPLVLPIWDTVLQILLITVVPVFIGVWMKRSWPKTTDKMQRYFKLGMPIMLAIAMVAAIFIEKKDVKVEAWELLEVLPWALALNILAMFSGWATAGILRLGKPAQITLGLEVGLHNSGLAIAVATSSMMLNNPTLAVPASTFALFSFFTAVLFGIIVAGKTLSLKEMFGLKGNGH
ncbi:MAG TPA: bile acid:sodium symporter family protein [Bacteroidia bacterium]|nr:bile acid:sodium symporter family protein [Bacteroidia bacterium]